MDSDIASLLKDVLCELRSRPSQTACCPPRQNSHCPTADPNDLRTVADQGIVRWNELMAQAEYRTTLDFMVDQRDAWASRHNDQYGRRGSSATGVTNP